MRTNVAIAYPELLTVGTALVYSGSDGDWHYAEVLKRDADGVVVYTPVGNHRVSFAALTDPEHWRHY